jgi:hypothetical protein
MLDEVAANIADMRIAVRKAVLHDEPPVKRPRELISAPRGLSRRPRADLGGEDEGAQKVQAPGQVAEARARS